MVTNGGCTQTFYLHASNKVEKQRWIEALERSKVQDIEAIEAAGEGEAETEDDGFESSDNEPQKTPKQVCYYFNQVSKKYCIICQLFMVHADEHQC